MSSFVKLYELRWTLAGSLYEVAGWAPVLIPIARVERVAAIGEDEREVLTSRAPWNAKPGDAGYRHNAGVPVRDEPPTPRTRFELRDPAREGYARAHTYFSDLPFEVYVSHLAGAVPYEGH